MEAFLCRLLHLTQRPRPSTMRPRRKWLRTQRLNPSTMTTTMRCVLCASTAHADPPHTPNRRALRALPSWRRRSVIASRRSTPPWISGLQHHASADGECLPLCRRRRLQSRWTIAQSMQHRLLRARGMARRVLLRLRPRAARRLKLRHRMPRTQRPNPSTMTTTMRCVLRASAAHADPPHTPNRRALRALPSWRRRSVIASRRSTPPWISGLRSFTCMPDILR